MDLFLNINIRKIKGQNKKQPTLSNLLPLPAPSPITYLSLPPSLASAAPRSPAGAPPLPSPAACAPPPPPHGHEHNLHHSLVGASVLFLHRTGACPASVTQSRAGAPPRPCEHKWTPRWRPFLMVLSSVAATLPPPSSPPREIARSGDTTAVH